MTTNEIIYQILKRIIILMASNLPKKIINSKEFSEILTLAETLKNRSESP